MEQDPPIAYQLLDHGVAVLASDGVQVGTVDHVVAASQQDIFHGLVISVPGHGRRFVGAADIASLHERGADLRIDSVAVQSLPEPGGGAPVFHEDPTMAKGWRHWVDRIALRGDWRRDS